MDLVVVGVATWTYLVDSLDRTYLLSGHGRYLSLSIYVYTHMNTHFSITMFKTQHLSCLSLCSLLYTM